MNGRKHWWASLVLVGGLLVTACGGSANKSESVATTSAPAAVESQSTEALSGTLTVMAPGTLKGVLERAKVAFEKEHHGVQIELNLGHVPALLTQLDGGVAADVLLTPDSSTMQQAADKGLLAAEPVVIARSALALVVPKGNPRGIDSVKALGDGGNRVAVCAVELPCGKLAQELARKNSISLDADTLEPGGSPGIVTKAATGEIDVGLVFATDVAAGGAAVEAVAIPEKDNVSSAVSVALLKASTNRSSALALIDLLASSQGRDIISAAGFEQP